MKDGYDYKVPEDAVLCPMRGTKARLAAPNEVVRAYGPDTLIPNLEPGEAFFICSDDWCNHLFISKVPK